MVQRMLPFISLCQAWLEKDQTVLEYLTTVRHIHLETIRKCRLGFFPKDAILPAQMADRELEKLRGRVIVPIFSEFGKIVGIAGRVPDPKVSGWWNTSFTKSSHLYGFETARKAIFDKNKAIVVEGYMDQIVASQAGLENVVAAMGTNLGVRRIGMLARYCDSVCMCFDTDQNSAGFLGVLRTLADMYSLGVSQMPSQWKVSMITLPVKVDPDDFIHTHGAEAFLALEKPLSEKQMKLAEAAYEELKMKITAKNKKETKHAQNT